MTKYINLNTNAYFYEKGIHIFSDLLVHCTDLYQRQNMPVTIETSVQFSDFKLLYELYLLKVKR